MIALHSALYIFNTGNRSPSGEGGLYPYRHVAFVCWILFPLLMASLAFINDQPYVNAGTYCYLPVRPFWYRLALSWVPRYVIFAIILLVYVAIYIYVHFKFKDFGCDGTLDEGTDGPEFRSLKRQPRRHTIPPTPQLASNGLISATASRRGSTANSMQEPPSLARLYESDPNDCQSPTRLDTADTANSTTRLFWTKEPRSDSDGSADTTLHLAPLHPTDIDIPAYPPTQLESARQSREPSSDWSAFMKSSSTRRSSLSFFAILHTKPEHAHTPESSQLSSTASTPANELQLTNSRGSNLAVSELQKTRERIRRQLRFMFIYPLVYITMWIVPFVSHVLQYQDRYAINPPYVLIAISLIFINCQCAVDAWLFSTREKPWRQIPETEGGFWESLRFWEASWGLPHSIHRRQSGGLGNAGRSKAEMAAEAKRAYRRRDEEAAAAIKEKLVADPQPGIQRTPTRKDWWDNDLQPLGADGASERVRLGRSSVAQMSPVIEESGHFDHAYSPKMTQDSAVIPATNPAHAVSDSAQDDSDSTTVEEPADTVLTRATTAGRLSASQDDATEFGIIRQDFVRRASVR